MKSFLVVAADDPRPETAMPYMGGSVLHPTQLAAEITVDTMSITDGQAWSVIEVTVEKVRETVRGTKA